MTFSTAPNKRQIKLVNISEINVFNVVNSMFMNPPREMNINPVLCRWCNINVVDAISNISYHGSNRCFSTNHHSYSIFHVFLYTSHLSLSLFCIKSMHATRFSFTLFFLHSFVESLYFLVFLLIHWVCIISFFCCCCLYFSSRFLYLCHYDVFYPT